MANIKYNKFIRAIINNKVLANYITNRVANMTEEEQLTGKINIEFTDGTSLILAVGPERNTRNKQEQKKTMQPA